MLGVTSHLWGQLLPTLLPVEKWRMWFALKVLGGFCHSGHSPPFQGTVILAMSAAWGGRPPTLHPTQVLPCLKAFTLSRGRKDTSRVFCLELDKHLRSKCRCLFPQAIS